MGYDALATVPDDQLLHLLNMIGLQHARLRVFRSLSEQIILWEAERLDPLDLSNDELVEVIATSVDGAGYKLSQCAALYAKGYHCGIIPVDSGMADMLGPCLGLRLPRGNRRHEVMRRHLEHEVKRCPDAYRALIAATGYGETIQPPRSVPPTWWVHLILVYFKRAFCNRRSPDACPLRDDLPSIGRMCEPQHEDRRLGALLTGDTPSRRPGADEPEVGEVRPSLVSSEQLDWKGRAAWPVLTGLSGGEGRRPPTPAGAG
jgi:hypothetical protein